MSPPAGPMLALTQCPDAASAERLALALVDGGLAASVNVLPGVRSFFRWDGATREQAEHLVLIKTCGERWQALEAAVREMHPYELPGLLAVPISAGLPAYLNWIRRESLPQA